MIKEKISKKGFTLVEVLMAISIFVVIATISTSILIRTVNMEKLTDIRNTMIDDARVFMEQLTSLINYGAVDYEEYYSVNVIQENDPNNPNKDIAYGVYYGAYGSRFFSAGNHAFKDGMMITPTINPNHLGIDCASTVGVAPKDCEVPYTDSRDKNEGQNPYDPDADEILYNNSYETNAFCDKNIKNNSPSCIKVSDTFTADELYIISDMMEEGGYLIKYIIARQKLNDQDDYGAVMTQMVGVDADENNFADFFACPDETCNGAVDSGELNVDDFYTYYAKEIKDIQNKNLSFKSDHTGIFEFGQKSFVPITPFRTSIKDLKFIISPVEDPYKAYAEPMMRMTPSVTILLTVEPSYADKQRYPGGWKDEYAVTIQRTVTAGIKGIPSFPPTDDLNWICEVLEAQGSPATCYDYIEP